MNKMETVKFRVRRADIGTIIAYETLANNSVGGWDTDHVFKGKGSAAITDIASRAVYREQFSTFYEAGTKKELYVRDKISAQDPNNKAAIVYGEIIFDKGCFSLKISKSNAMQYDIGQTPPLYDFCNLKLI